MVNRDRLSNANCCNGGHVAILLVCQLEELRPSCYNDTSCTFTVQLNFNLIITRV